MSFDFRPLKPEDAENFRSFIIQVPHESTHTMQYVGREYPSVEEYRERFAKNKDDLNNLALGAFDENGNCVGYLNFRREWHDHPWAQHVGSFGMVIAKSHWGQGIGKALLAQMEDHAKSIGITRIEAHVRIENNRGLTLYRRNGYRIEGTRIKAALIDGRFQNEYFIAKLLDDPFLNWKPTPLTTERLILRPIELNDAEAIYDYAKDPEVARYVIWEPHASIEDTKTFIYDVAFQNYRDGLLHYAIALKEKPETVLGTIGAFWISKPKKCLEIGYVLARKYWGQGLIPEAAKIFAAECFKTYDIERLQAHTRFQNKQSGRVLEKIGMKFEGTHRRANYIKNEFWDMNLYAMLRSELTHA